MYILNHQPGWSKETSFRKIVVYVTSGIFIDVYNTQDMRVLKEALRYVYPKLNIDSQKYIRSI